MKQNHHFPRRVMALFLSAAMVLGCTGTGALAAEDEDVLLPEESETQTADLEEETEEVSPQATVDPADASDLADDLSGSGTEADPFLIQNETDLRRLSEVCATHYNGSTTVNLAGVYFLQTADITLTKSWTSIGNTTGYYFGGIYDGGGYSVDLNGKSKDGAYSTPIFGCIRDASVHDLQAKGTVTNTSTTAGVHTAGVVGFASGASTIYNCVNEANVSGKAFAGGVVAELANTSSVTGCENYGTVTQTTGVYSSAAFGGVVGKNTGTGAVENCMNYGAVSYGAIASSNAAVGGVIGAVNAAGPVVNCGNQGAVNGEKSATSTYAGGVIGYVNKAAAVSGCYNSGSIGGTVNSAGGVIGYLSAASNVSNCMNLGAVTNGNSSGAVGGVAGYSNSGVHYTGCYNAGAVTGGSASYQGAFTGRTTSSYKKAAYYVNCYYIGDNAPAAGGVAYPATTASVPDPTTAVSTLDDGWSAALLAGLGDAFTADRAGLFDPDLPILTWMDPNAAYRAAFTVKDRYTGLALDGWTVVIEGEGGIADPEALMPGHYTYTVTKDGYVSASASFSVEKSNVSLAVSLDPVAYEHTFKVTPAGAELTLTNSDSAVGTVAPKAAENGSYTFDLYRNYGDYTWSARAYGYAPGAYTYTVRKAGLATQKGSFTVADGALTVPVDMAAPGPWDGTVDTGWYEPGQAFYTISTPEELAGFAAIVNGTASGIEKTNFAGASLTVTLAEKTQWDGAGVDTDRYTKDPSASAFYIYTEDELAGFAKLVNDGATTFEGKTVKLMADLNLGDGLWTPIGGYSATGTKYFAGTFDGGGHSITVNDGQFGANETGFGLFGYIKGTVSARAAVKNLVLYGNVTAQSAAYTYFGGVSGYATYTDFTNVSNRMNITVTVTTADVGFIDLGGLVGWSVFNNFDCCSNTGNITGIMNAGAGKVAVCYVGGLVGMATQATAAESQWHIVDCYNTGNITSTGGSVSRSAGIIGNTAANSQAKMANCYNSGVTTSGQPLIGAGSFETTGTDNNYYLDSTLPAGTTALLGEPKTSAELSALAPTLGSSYKSSSLYPVLYWEATPYSIEMEAAPNKTVYNDFEDFIDEGMTLLVKYSEDDGGTVIVSGWQIEDGAHLCHRAVHGRHLPGAHHREPDHPLYHQQ